MDKIFKQAKDKNVAKVIIYGHTDNLLYSDSDHTNKLDKSSLKDLFFKGCVVKTESEDLLPVKYFETENYAGMVFKSGDSIIAYYSKEYTPEPSGISIIPINSYTTEDTGYGDGFLDITAIVPPVIDEAVFETYSAAIVAALADDSLDNINHTITIGNQTLTDQIATYDETNEIVYLGNLSLYDDSAEDTGEDWFLIVGSTLELTTRTPMTINFGMNYEVEEPEEEVVWEDDVTFATDTETGMLVSEIHYETDLDLTANYTFTCGEETISGKFTEINDYYILGTFGREGAEGAALFYDRIGSESGGALELIYADSTFDTETTYHAKLINTEPSVLVYKSQPLDWSLEGDVEVYANDEDINFNEFMAQISTDKTYKLTIDNIEIMMALVNIDPDEPTYKFVNADFDPENPGTYMMIHDYNHEGTLGFAGGGDYVSTISEGEHLVTITEALAE